MSKGWQTGSPMEMPAAFHAQSGRGHRLPGVKRTEWPVRIPLPFLGQGKGSDRQRRGLWACNLSPAGHSFQEQERQREVIEPGLGFSWWVKPKDRWANKGPRAAGVDILMVLGWKKCKEDLKRLN